MTVVCAYDTETTGKVNFKSPVGCPQTPRLVQLAYTIFDDESNEIISQVNLVVKPDGWSIPEEAANVHGITTDLAYKRGIALQSVMSVFAQHLSICDKRIAFNDNYDLRIVMAELLRINNKKPNFVFENAIDKLNTMELEDVMHAMTPICAIPAQYQWQGKHKWPTLMEAYEFAHGEKFDNAHDAMADVNATVEVYKWLLQRS